MKIYYPKQARDALADGDTLKEEACRCTVAGDVQPDCPLCDGHGKLYFHESSSEQTAQILANLASQGVPVGKLGH